LGRYAGTGFGAEATSWYAEQFNDTGNPVYFLGGAFSALWTPETYLQTAIALAAAPYAAAEITAAGAQSVAAAGREAAKKVVEEVIAVPIPLSPKSLSAPKSTDLKVIGRLDDTAVAKNWKGHDVFDIPYWTMEKNMEWVDQSIKNKHNFYTASPESGNMILASGRFKGQPTVYAQEIQRLKYAGYNRVGDYYVHPDNVGIFKP
jgi:hypothetical protein